MEVRTEPPTSVRQRALRAVVVLGVVLGMFVAGAGGANAVVPLHSNATQRVGDVREVAIQLTAASLPAGVAAVNNGSWGFQEIVFTRAVTRSLPDYPQGIVANLWRAGLWSIPLSALTAGFVLKAQEAKRTGQCFALVRPGWYLPLYFPAVSGWGCR